jgi:hypothetical protein
MARPRKPTAVLEASGAFINHPNRKRPHEPKPVGELGDPPETLSQTERLLWLEIAADLPPGVGTNADRKSFEIMVCLMNQFRQSRRITGAELSQLTGLFGRFGMTPADRSKVKVSNDNAQDPLEAFLGQQPSREVTQ